MNALQNKMFNRQYALFTEVVQQCYISLSLFQLTYLPPPWGDCKATAMDSDFFNSYSITACRIDCETRYLVENCNCRMVHMPGRRYSYKNKAFKCLFFCSPLEVLSFLIVMKKAILKEQTFFFAIKYRNQILSHSSGSENAAIFTLCLCSDYSWHLLSTSYI